MNEPRPSSPWPRFTAWMVFAAAGGVICLALPPYLAEGGLKNPAYGWPLIPWFALAWANVRVAASMGWFFALGLALGLTQPRRWFLVAAAAVASPAVLLLINVVHDWTRDGTSHNLVPFEFLICGIITLPALAGSWLGSLLRRLIQPRDPAE